jgi:hypothetical protein
MSYSTAVFVRFLICDQGLDICIYQKHKDFFLVIAGMNLEGFGFTDLYLLFQSHLWAKGC